MVPVPRGRYWPYDEVSASRYRTEGRFLFSTPWISASIGAEPPDIPRVESIVGKISSGQLQAGDLEDVSWLFSALAQYPLAYLLPSIDAAAIDRHALADRALLDLTPQTMLARIGDDSELQAPFERLAANAPKSWSWDAAAALQFSAVSARDHDPRSLFTVARRFHLVDSVDDNRTEELSERVRGLRSDPIRFRRAAALLVRQNHYVTQKCDSALRPALRIAQGSERRVAAFIRAEAGHDVLLGRAMRALEAGPESVPVVDPAYALMEVFRIAAGRNLLAFAMVVDMFERSSYREQDPLAALLAEGGLAEAGKHIDIHRAINDSGGHENVAIGFLETMAPIDAEYATEALRLAELVTWLIHGISSSLIRKIEGGA